MKEKPTEWELLELLWVFISHHEVSDICGLPAMLLNMAESFVAS